MWAYRSSETAITFQVKKKPLEEIRNTKDAIATPFERFDFVVQAFDKPTAESVDKVVGDFILPVVERFQELVKAL